ncbi:MAG: hypothetical protein IJ994_01175 [Firmicutes bacterium]|nr:hypothetical protein [Bacillota bacterium]MBR7149096.1 hypothetical protein [Bacillota bacterium]
MNLIELKEKNDRWRKLQSMIQAMEADADRQDQWKDILVQCRSEAEGLSGCCEEYESAWEKKRAEVEALGGDAWDDVLRCMNEIQKSKGIIEQLANTKFSSEEEMMQLQMMVDEEVEKIRSMDEVIQWLVIEA